MARFSVRTAILAVAFLTFAGTAVTLIAEGGHLRGQVGQPPSAGACEQLDRILRSGTQASPSARMKMQQLEEQCREQGFGSAPTKQPTSPPKTQGTTPPRTTSNPAAQNARLKMQLQNAETRIADLEEKLKTVLEYEMQGSQDIAAPTPHEAPQNPTHNAAFDDNDFEPETFDDFGDEMMEQRPVVCSLIARFLGLFGIGRC